MQMWSALLFGITWHFSPSAFAYRETAALFPIIARACYFQVTLPRGDGLCPVMAGKSPATTQATFLRENLG